MDLTICEKWTMRVDPPSDKWFLDYVIRAPRDAGIHLTAGWGAYNLLADLEIDTAMEYFGGMGAQSLMIQELFSPILHHAYDFSPEAALHLTETIDAEGYIARQADSYDSKNFQPGAELVGLDFGDLTVWKTREKEPHRELLDRVFGDEPEAVVLTDVACRYLHLHRERYETILGPGTCASYETYLDALADRLEALYGYVMVGGFWHRWSTVMALVPNGQRGQFVPTPDSPVGLAVAS